MLAEKTERKATRITALDRLEAGNSIEEYGVGKVRKQKVEGVTQKELYKDVFFIAFPAFVELTLTQIASMVDLMMVGQLGPWALSSVGLTTQPKFLLTTAFIAMNVGVTAMIARYRGAGQQEKANAMLRQSMLLSLLLSLIASVIGFFFSEDLVRFMGASEPEVLAGGTIYLQIQMGGFVFMALTTTMTAALRGIGDSRTAMIYNLISNLVNVVFNYLLIYGKLGFPRLEVAGASLATVIGQIVAFAIAAGVLFRGKRYLSLSLRESYKPEMQNLKNLLNIGCPAMLEQLIMRVGVIMYSKIVASLGTVDFATHQVCMNILAMSFMIGQAFAVSATSLVGQSLGKKRPDMAQAYCRCTHNIGILISIFLGLFFMFCGKPVIGLYTSDPAVIEEGAVILWLLAFVQPFQAAQFILAGGLRGAGDTRITAVIIFITTLIIRPGLAFFTVNTLHWGLAGAWIAMAADQLVRSFLVYIRYYSGKWKSLQF